MRAEMASEMAERAFEELRLRKDFGSSPRKQQPGKRDGREIDDAGATSADTVSDFEDDSEVAGECARMTSKRIFVLHPNLIFLQQLCAPWTK